MVSGQQGRNPSLDFLRCIAIILVMFRHLQITGGGLFNLGARFLNGGGWVGVDLFFVLSGFLVSGLIFSEYETTGGFNAGRFFVRRGFKIYPVYYLFLAITLALTVHRGLWDAVTSRRYLYEALFIANYTPLHPEHGWIWTLCVEEHFYLVLCILMVVVIRLRWMTTRMFYVVYFFFLVLGLSLRTYALLHDDRINLYIGASHLRFDSLFFGVLLAWLYRNGAGLKRRFIGLTVAAAAGLLLPFLFTRYGDRDQGLNTVVFLSTTSVCCGYLMIRLLDVRAPWMRPFAFIGKYSYSIYLFHEVVNHNAQLYFSGYAYYAVYFLGSLLAGIIISKLVEYPFLAIRDQFFPSLSKQPKPSGIGNSA